MKFSLKTKPTNLKLQKVPKRAIKEHCIVDKLHTYYSVSSSLIQILLFNATKIVGARASPFTVLVIENIQISAIILFNQPRIDLCFGSIKTWTISQIYLQNPQQDRAWFFKHDPHPHDLELHFGCPGACIAPL